MFGQTAAYMIAGVQNGKEASMERTEMDQAADSPMDSPMGSSTGQFVEQFSGNPIAFEITPVRSLLSQTSEWIKDAANGTYLEEATLSEVVASSAVEDFKADTSVPAALALTTALMMPFVAVSFAATAFLSGIVFLFGITR